MVKHTDLSNPEGHYDNLMRHTPSHLEVARRRAVVADAVRQVEAETDPVTAATRAAEFILGLPPEEGAR